MKKNKIFNFNIFSYFATGAAFLGLSLVVERAHVVLGVLLGADDVLAENWLAILAEAVLLAERRREQLTRGRRRQVAAGAVARSLSLEHLAAARRIVAILVVDVDRRRGTAVTGATRRRCGRRVELGDQVLDGLGLGLAVG